MPLSGFGPELMRTRRFTMATVPPMGFHVAALSCMVPACKVGGELTSVLAD